MIKTVIFDLAEVYLQGMLGIQYEIAETLDVNREAVLSSHLAGEKMRLLFKGQISENEYWARAIKESNYPESVNGRPTADYLKSVMRRNFKEIPGTREIIEDLNNAGYQLGLLSDHAREWIEYCELQFPLKKLFGVRCYSFETGYTKKSPESFLYTLKKLDADPAITLFIDDMDGNVRRAQSHPVNIQYAHKFVGAGSLRNALPGYGINLSV